MKRMFVALLLIGCGGSSGGDGGGGAIDAGGGPDAWPCVTDLDCTGDTRCVEQDGVCVPWGIGTDQRDDMCARDVVPGVFLPGVQCEWLGPPPGDPYPDHRNVLSTPMVIDFAAGSDPELSRASIVFVSYNGIDGGGASCGLDPAFQGVIRVIDGRTCEQQASIGFPAVVAATSLALGDLDGDGTPEIVGARRGGGLAAWTPDGQGGFAMRWETASTFAGTVCDWAGPAIHDLDDDGVPEIVFYGAVYDMNGNTITEALGPLSSGGSTGYIPVVANIDADAPVELVHGAAVYQWDSVSRTWVLEASLGPAAQTAVADLGTYGADPTLDNRAVQDGIAEVVAVSGGELRVYTAGGRLLFSSLLPGGGQGGSPTIADFDGDGRAEMASAGGAAYTVFDLDEVDGILWTQPSQDLSSNVTGSSVFDFEGDGRAEVVYADECFTRVYDGQTGQVMYSRYRTSCTWYENPVIADVDADYNAEIVIGSNTNCSVTCPMLDPIFDGIGCAQESDCPGTTTCVREMPGDALGRCRCTADADCGGQDFVCRDPIAGPSPMGQVCRAQHGGMSTAFGVRVIADGLDRWVNTRSIWNQHAYSVTNVGDRGEIPRTSMWQKNWQVPGLNNFRQNAPGEGLGGGKARTPDLTVRNGAYTCAGAVAGFTFEVCNRGGEPVADGLAVTVYAPDGSIACTAVTMNDVFPGQCVPAECKWSGAGAGPADVTIVVDDGGDGMGANTECREDNNRLVIPGVRCG